MEPLLPAATLVVVGGGHVGKAVVHLAKWLGFRVVLSDDREEFCNPDTAPEADEYIVCAMSEIPDRLRLDARTSLALTTRGSSVDAIGLPSLLSSKAGYIGVIGSKRRWLTTVRELRAAGVPQEQIDRVHSPMGLELRAETPEEIAVSIVAEILMWRDQGTGASMSEASTKGGPDRRQPHA